MSTDVIKLARQACSAMAMADPGPIAYVFSRPQLEHFAALVISDFLERTGQYVTNDASREAALAAARSDERERLALEFDRRSVYADGTPSTGWYEPNEPAEIIRGL